jgi:hypothetical protein
MTLATTAVAAEELKEGKAVEVHGESNRVLHTKVFSEESFFGSGAGAGEGCGDFAGEEVGVGIDDGRFSP